MTDSDMTAFFNMIRAAEELVESYEDDFREVERSVAGQNDLVIWLSAFQFQWLRTKFQHFWNNDVTHEAALLKLRPNTMVFGPTDFERLVQAILGLVEGMRFRETSASHDEGVDLVHHQRLDLNTEAWATTVVQCKLYRGFVPVADLRDFFGVMVAKTATGLFFTTGKITPQGRRFLPQANKSSMANCFHLITERELNELMKICDDLAEMIVNPDDIPETEFRTEAEARRGQARELIYSRNPIQGAFW